MFSYLHGTAYFVMEIPCELLCFFNQPISSMVNGLVGVYRNKDTEATLQHKESTFGQLGMLL